MITELTPETFFSNVHTEGPLHIVMHYGATCGPCKLTMPHYQVVAKHFEEYNIKNVKFYSFHNWETTNRIFLEQNKLISGGVPTFRYFYMGDIINEMVSSYNDPNQLKQAIMDTIKAIEVTTKTEFNLYAS